MLVINRSNDIVWGMLNVNIVTFTLLQEYIAARLGIKMGKYTVMSDNAHIYEATMNKIACGTTEISDIDGDLFNNPDGFPEEVEEFCLMPYGNRGFWNNHILNVASIMDTAHKVFKDKGAEEALKYLDDTNNRTPWVYASRRWLERKLK